MKFYIASSFSNTTAVRTVANQLKLNGFIQTYDWIENQNVNSLKDLREIGYLEKNAILNSDIFIIMLPAGKGAHIELGIALGAMKEIYLYSETNEMNEIETTSTFYQLDEVKRIIGTMDELIKTINLE
ncbi:MULTISPECIES: group-specific protein [unclassified Paenibacillus]|uniref:group-specific protein n=1 Tax=unclassified Paenibacillus TaxID=185978 RepID=UPI000FE1899F|nr:MULTISPECIES: group-specific protein [unclassified Paenibacillus]MCM3175440.1 group-specific protein [Paenibacillus sp. MER 99-2]